MLEQQLQPLPGRGHLVGGEPAGKLGGELPGLEALLQLPQRGDRPAGQAAAPPLPEHRAQLVLLAEADPVIATVEVPVGSRQQVADLAIGVVHHGIEDGHVAQRRVVGPAGQRDNVHRLVSVDPQLAHTGTEGAVAEHGRRHHRESAGHRHPVGGHLPAGQRAGREVPQRPLPRHRLVHAGRLAPAVPDRAVQRRVRRHDEPALDLDRALAEQVERGRLGRVRLGRVRLGRGGGPLAPPGPTAGRPVRHGQPGDRSAAGRRAHRCPAAARRAGTAAVPGSRSASRAARTRGPWPP